MLSCFSHVQLYLTLWTVACQAPLSMRFSRQEYWSGLPFSAPGDLMGPGMKPRSPALQADSSPSELLWKHKDLINIMKVKGSLKCHTNLSSLIKYIIF